MSEAPELDRDGLRDELKTLHRHRHRVLTAAFYARRKGNEPGVEVELDGKSVAWRTVPVHCELDLRRALSHRAEGENLALLLDYWPERLAADLLARLARGQVIRIDPGRQIARDFGMSAVSGEVLACKPLVEELRRAGRPTIRLTTSGTTLDLATAWRGLLAREAGWDVGAGITEVALLAHAAEREVPEGLVARLGPSTEVGKALLAYLARPDTAGALAPWIWHAWLAGQGRTFASLAFLFEPAVARWTSDPAFRATLLAAVLPLGASLRDLVATSATNTERSLVERWAGVLEPLVLRLRLQPEVLRDLVERASQHLTPELEGSVITSRHLRPAFTARSRRLAANLGALLASAERKAPSADLVGHVREDLEQLRRHDLATTGKHREQLDRADMAVRLVAYVISRMTGGDRLAEEVATYGTTGHLFALAQHQVREGAWVDHARDRARGVGEEDLDRAIDAVVARVDAIRDRDDEAFARAYAAYLAAGSPTSSHVVPIAKALEHFAVAFLKDEPHRKLAVVLLDGMAWANAVELLESMEGERYAPLRFADGKVMPMLAALPTLTEVSRSAFFAGKPIKTGEAADTSKDPERFAAHAGLRKIGIEDAPLLLKADVAAGTGGLGKKARDLLAGDVRVVGLVVNAIDDQLKGAKQIRVHTTLDTIKPMRDLLEAATEGGRALLLVADHGHVRTDRMVSVGFGTGAGKRYRFLSKDEPARPEEIAVGRDAAFVAPGKDKVAMLFRERDAYGTPSATGEHGGASIAEVVAPAILVGSDNLRAQVHNVVGVDDSKLDVAPFARPDWWDLQLPKKAAGRAAAPAVATPPRRKKSEPKMQVALPGFEPPAAAPAPVAASPEAEESRVLVALRSTKIFGHRSPEELKRYRAIVAPRIALLVEAGAPVPSHVFAQKAGVLPTSVGGAVAEMQEWMNFDATVIELDFVSKRVMVNRDLLLEYVPEVAGT